MQSNSRLLVRVLPIGVAVLILLWLGLPEKDDLWPGGELRGGLARDLAETQRRLHKLHATTDKLRNEFNHLSRSVVPDFCLPQSVSGRYLPDYLLEEAGGATAAPSKRCHALNSTKSDKFLAQCLHQHRHPPRHAQTNFNWNHCREHVRRFLPINKSGCLNAHHWWDRDTAHGRWNGDDRFRQIESITDYSNFFSDNTNNNNKSLNNRAREQEIVLYIGGNQKGEDGLHLLKMYPHIDLYVYEPVPMYYKELVKHYDKTLPKSTREHVYIFDYGIGGQDEVLSLPASALKDQGTFVMDAGGGEKEGEEYIKLKIRDGEEVLNEILAKTNKKSVQLVHANEEGGEWGTFKRWADQGSFSKIDVLSFSLHAYPADRQQEEMAWDWCSIQSRLTVTHEEGKFSSLFGWNRYVKRGLK